MFGRITPVVRVLLMINIGIFLIFQLFLKLPLADYLGFRYIGASSFQPYQVFAYMFVHAGFWHLFSNMLALFIFGPMLETLLGSNRFIVFYLVTGLGAGALYATVNYFEMSSIIASANAFALSPDPDTFLRFVLKYGAGITHSDVYQNVIFPFMQETFPEAPNNPIYIKQANEIVQAIVNGKANSTMVGASGAVFGILLAFGWLFPNLELMLLIPPIPIKAKYLVTLYAAYEIYSLINTRVDDSVAHLAHIGGMLFAYLLIKVWGLRSQN
jgi:membrane associated rhomboid family serine protease